MTSQHREERPPKDIPTQHGAAETPDLLTLHLLQTRITAEAEQVLLCPLSQMEDFEFSVDISDRDWECFFAECEECNLLPPSLAGVDDSGMSDMDDTGSVIAKRVHKVELRSGFSDCSIDGPPHCEGSPVEPYLGKHGIGGMESILSGSEEDIHLQSVNIFFERLKNVAEGETRSEPSRVRAGKNREATPEEGHCSDGKQANSSSLPKNIPKLNSLSARGETAVGKETAEPVDTVSNIMKTMKKNEPGSSVSPEPAAHNSLFNTCKSVHPETELFILEEACTETRADEATQQSHSHDSPDGAETTPHTNTAIKVEVCTPLDDAKQEDLFTSQLTPSKKCSPKSWSNPEIGTNGKWKEDPNVSQSEATSTNKTASQESSPSASIKRKRRKKRRLSVEQTESVHGYEKQVSVKASDSEKEQHAWRGATSLCVCEDVDLFNLNEPQKNVMSSLTTHSVTSNLPLKICAREIKVCDLPLYSHPGDSQYQSLPELRVRQGRCKATRTAESNAANKKSVTPLSQADNSVMSATNSSGNVATNLQPCSKLQVGLNKHGVTAYSDLDTETAHCEGQDAHAGSVRPSDKMNHSIMCYENEQSCTAKVKLLPHSISPSTGSNDPTVEVGQNDNLTAAKSVLAEEAGNSGGDNHSLCQREAEPQQQLEVYCHYTDRYISTLGNTHLPLPANGMSSSDAHNTKPKQFNSTQVDCAKLKLDTSNSLPDKGSKSEVPSSVGINVTVQQTQHPLVLNTLSKFDVLSEKSTKAERADPAASQITAEMNRAGESQRETKKSTSEDLLTSPSDITPLSSCCTLDTESVPSLSNGNITDTSGSSCLSFSQNDSGLLAEKTSLILTKQEKEDVTSGLKSLCVSNDPADSNRNSVIKAEDALAASRAKCEPEKELDSQHSVFAMSSFWSDMEKLTINDILGLRMISKGAPAPSLPPLHESEETDMMDSGFFTQPDESKSNEDTLSDPNSAGSSSASVSSRGFMWESEPVPVSLGADIYTENMMLNSVSDISRPVLPGSAQMGLRKICKNVSVHNLRALESFSCTWKRPTLDEGNIEKVELITDAHLPKQDKEVDCLTSSATDSFRLSLPDIFQYFFGGKEPKPSQPTTDITTTYYTEGNSVPETYDHFFSEFDTESFFYPHITAEDRAEDKLVPIFSYSRSANRNLQFPEAYDYFFASSSSDDSSVESDEEDNCGPVRVVNRFSRKSSTSKISSDTYENFFTDSDLKQNFFWKNTFSFRNISFTGSTVQKQNISNPLVSTRQSSRSLHRTVRPINVLGNQDVIFPDPLLYNLEDRLSRQLARQPFSYGDLQTAVSNPRLDAPFLPLRQSDMCLVCIAFASWVLKTANPQAGDAWKAVLLANVSALSAIRYLRKYVKKEASASEKKLHLPALSDS